MLVDFVAESPTHALLVTDGDMCVPLMACVVIGRQTPGIFPGGGATGGGLLYYWLVGIS